MKFQQVVETYETALEFLHSDIEHAHNLLILLIKAQVPYVKVLRNIEKILKHMKDFENLRQCHELLYLNTDDPDDLKRMYTFYSQQSNRNSKTFARTVWKKYHEVKVSRGEISAQAMTHISAHKGLMSGTTLKLKDQQQKYKSLQFYQKNKIDQRSLPHSLRQIIEMGKHKIHYYKKIPAQEGDIGARVEEVVRNSALAKALNLRGVKSFYQFQLDAYYEIFNGNDIIISAPTGNGKTEAFLVPVLDRLSESKTNGTKVLIIYPTKALAQDQVKKLTYYCDKLSLRVAVYDGDTSEYWRKKILQNPPDILITNPDIINYHLGLGKKKQLFQDLLSTVDTIILDEIHTYTGLFGTNMVLILQRMERLFGEKQIIGASATIANPLDLGKKLTGRNMTVVACNHPRQPMRHVIMLEPLEEVSKQESFEIIVKTLAKTYKTLVFFDSHKAAEHFYYKIRESFPDVAIHRAGLPKKYRKQVEQDFRSGKLNALIATPTLELGMDVGDLDWVITEPVSINRVEQRSGRAGRKGQESGLIIHLVKNDPISNYYANNPKEYFAHLELSVLHTDNKYVVVNQILLAILDRPVYTNERFYQKYREEYKFLLEEEFPRITKNGNKLEITEEGVIYCKKYCKTIRGSNESVLIKENKIIGERGLPMAISELFPGATYFARGQRYKVKNLKLGKFPRKGLALVRKAKHYEFEKTSPYPILKPKVLDFIERKKVLGVEVGYSEVRVLILLKRYGIYSNAGRWLRTVEIENPITYSFETSGVLFKVPDILSKNSTIHGLTHIIQHTLKSIGAKDIKVVGLSPTGYILIYDDSSGGNGLSLMIFENFEEILHRTYNILNSCKCRSPFGCPKCMIMFFCPHKNKDLEKGETKRILEIIRNNTNDIQLGSTYNKFNKTYL